MESKDVKAIEKEMEKLIKEIEAMPLDVKLDTSVKQELINGLVQVVRNHEYKSSKRTEKIYSVTELTKELSKWAGKPVSTNTSAADYGTLVHRIIEELEKKTNPFGLKGKGDSVTEKQILDFIKKLSAPGSKHSLEDLADTRVYTGASTKEQEKILKSLFNNVNQYLRLRDQLKLKPGGQKFIEKPLGMTVTIGGKKYNVAGTLDQLFSGKLMDLKTSKEIGPDYGLQLQLLRLLAQVNGIPLDKNMKIINMPRQWREKNPKEASVVDVLPMDPKVVKDILATALQIQGASNPDALRAKGRQLLKLGGLKFDLTPGTGSFVDKAGKKIDYATYGGKSINQWVKYINEHGAGLGGLQALMAGMSSDDARRFKANIFRMDNAMSGTGQLVFHHTDDQNLLHAFRYLQRPELYNPLSPEQLKMLKSGSISGLNFSPKTLNQLAEAIGKSSVYENIVTNEFDPSYLLGDFSPTDLLKLISTARTKKQKENIFTNIHRALQDDLVNGDVSSKHNAMKFISGLNERWDIGDRENRKDEQHKALTQLLSFLRRNDDTVRMALDSEHEFSTVDEMVEETLWRDRHTPGKSEDDDEYYNELIDSMLRQGQGKSLKDKLQKYRKGVNSKGKSWDSIYKAQLPHRLARLFEAHSFYDSTFRPIYDKHSDLFENYDDFLQTIFKGNPAMLKQYKTSKAASEWLTEMSEKYPGQNIFQLLTNPEIFGEDVIYPYQWGGADMSAEGMNLFSLIRDIAKENPDLLKDKGMLADFEHQMSGRKLQYWDEHNEQARLLGMVPIDNLLHFYNKDGTEKPYTETARALGMITSQGLAGKLLSRSPMQALVDEDLDQIGYEMFGRDSELFKDIYDKFSHQYGFWKEAEMEKLDKKYGVGEWDEDKLLSRSRFLKSKQGQAFLGTSTSRINELISKYNGRNNFMSEVMGPIITENFGIAKAQELEELNARHEREEAEAAEAERRRLAEEDAVEVVEEVVNKELPQVIEATIVKGKRKYTKRNSEYWTTRGKRTGKDVKVEDIITDSVLTGPSGSEGPGGPVGPGGGPGGTYISGDPININNIEKATIKASTIVQNISGGGSAAGGAGGSDDSGSSGKGGPKGPRVPKERPRSERQGVYEERMASYYYRAYTDLDYQEYAIQQAKAREVSRAKIEMYDAQLKEIEYQKDLALKQYQEYKRTHGEVDYDTVEGRQQSILRQKKSALYTGQREQTNLFNQVDVTALRWLKRMMEGGIVLKFLQLARQGIKQLVNEAKQLDQVMTNLRIVTNANRDEASMMINSYNDLAKQLGVTTKEVANSANEWLRQGYEAAEVNDLITASMYLSKLGMIDSTAATKDLTSAIKGFKLEASEAMSVVDKLTSIDLRAATSAGEIAEGLAQFANLGSLSGVDIDQASAYVATIADVSQKSGSSVGQALKTIISRFGNVKAGAFNKLNLDEENSDTTEKLNDVERVLNKLGISMRDTNLQFKDFDEVLDEIAAKWETLDNVSKKAIANAFAGVRQQESFVTLMENYDKYQELLEASRNSAGTAESKYGAYRDSYQAAAAGLTAAWEKIVNDAEVNNILKELTKILTKLVEWIPQLLKHLPSIIAAIENVKAIFGQSLFQKAGRYLGSLIPQGVKDGFTKKLKQWNLAKELNKEIKKGGKDVDKELVEEAEHELELEKEHTKVLEDNIDTVEGSTDTTKEYTTNLGAMSDDTTKYNTTLDKSTTATTLNTTATELGTATENQETAANKMAVQSEQAEAAANKQSALSEGKSGGGGMGKFGAAMAGINIVANQALAGLTAFSTQGTTHKYKGDTVESSEEAQKAGSGWAALATFAIPIFGSFIGEKIADAVTSSIDRERDHINHIASVAQKNLSGLEGLDAGIEAMAEVGSNESINAADKFLADIYSSDNAETRAVLEQYLGDKGSLYDIVNKIKEGNEEAYRDLKIAQLEAKKGQIINNYAGQLNKAQSKAGKAYNAYDNYAAELNGWTVAGGAGLGLAGGAGVGAAAGGIAVALGASGPVGWIIGAIGAVIGLGFGIYAGIKQAEAEKKAEEERHAREAKFNSMTYSQKIEEVQKTLEKAERQGNTEVVDKCNELLQALNEQKALVNQINNEINKITQEQALYSAKIGDEYITDMSVVALQQAGQDAIVEAYAKAIEENGGLLGYQLFDKNGNLTDSGYQYALSQLKQQDNDAIGAVLSGGVYTLSEILKLREKYGDERWIMDIMQNFATALNIPLDLLEDFEDRFGSLKLSEVLMSTAEIQTLMGNYTSLLSSITTGAGDTSKWMETIISQFPELIAYMGDTSALFTHLTTKINQLSEAYLQSQYEDIISSTEFYKTIKDSFEGRLSQENIDALTKAGVDSVSSILSWVQQQYDSNGNLNEAGTAVLDALKETVDEYGVEVTSNILKSYYDQIIDFRVKTLDKELENLNAQKEALQQINSQREYENKLIEAKLRLENASKEKKRVYRAGVGWVYEADQTAIAEAQKNLEELENQKTIAELDRQIAELTYEKEKLSSIYDEKNYETLSELYQAYLDQNELTNASSQKIYESIKDGTDGITKALEELIQQDTESDAANKKSALEKAKEAWEALQKETYGTSGYNTALQNYHNAYQNAVNNGATESDFEDWGSYNINGTNTSAWDTGSGDVNKQLADARILFKLNDTGTPSQYFQGTASLGDPQYDSTILNYIFGDLKNKKGWVWAKGINGDKGFKPGAKGSDARFSIKKEDEDFLSYIGRISQIDGVPDEMVFTGYDGTNESVYVKNGIPYKLVGTSNTVGMDIIKGDLASTVWAREQMARGSFDFRGGSALINELGPEAIVTPFGTVTTLPSHTGVVPADITKNLWELGEVAPMIQKHLLGQVNNDMSHKVVWGNDESFNIGVMNMTLNPDSSFDIDAFVDAMKTHVALNKNNRR